MAEATLDLLARMVERVLANQHNAEIEQRDVRGRLAAIERAVSEIGLLRAEVNSRIDGVVERLDRVERRLELHNGRDGGASS